MLCGNYWKWIQRLLRCVFACAIIERREHSGADPVGRRCRGRPGPRGGCPRSAAGAPLRRRPRTAVRTVSRTASPRVAVRLTTGPSGQAARPGPLSRTSSARSPGPGCACGPHCPGAAPVRRRAAVLPVPWFPFSGGSRAAVPLWRQPGTARSRPFGGGMPVRCPPAASRYPAVPRWPRGPPAAVAEAPRAQPGFLPAIQQGPARTPARCPPASGRHPCRSPSFADMRSGPPHRQQLFPDFFQEVFRAAACRCFRRQKAWKRATGRGRPAGRRPCRPGHQLSRWGRRSAKRAITTSGIPAS